MAGNCISLFVIFYIIPIVLSVTGIGHLSEHKRGFEYKKEKILEVISWHPHSGLGQYHTFEDTTVYKLYVPDYTSELALLFQYAYFSTSDNTCNKTVTILVQHGSPAVPYRDEIQHTKSWLYENADAYKTEVSLGRNQEKFIKSPQPGYWYITSFMPATNKVKKITEQGLTKSPGKCYCALSVTQVLTRPVIDLQVIGKRQNVTDVFPVQKYGEKYYQYVMPGYSRNLKVKIRKECIKPSERCLLKLSVSARSLPGYNTTECIANTTCTINIEWPQPGANYYLWVRGKNATYELIVDHTDCLNGTSCPPVVEMTRMQRVRLINVWGYHPINGMRAFYAVHIEPSFVGATLRVDFLTNKMSDSVSYKMCITKDVLPFDVFEKGNGVYCRTWVDDDYSVDILFPQAARWYIAVGVSSTVNQSMPSYIHVYTKRCLDTTCSGHGSCGHVDKAGMTYGVCECDYGYSGWTCEKYHDLDILAICLLTISNIAFLPGMFIAFRRKLYPEAIVYLFNMYCSTVYHACDSHGFCIYKYDILQLSDFFSSTLSVWYTLIAMVKLPLFWHRTLNVLAVLCIFISIQVSPFGLTMIAVPAGIAVAFVLLSFGVRSYNRRGCFPSRRRWLFFIAPAVVLALVSIIVYSLLETTANYKYLHSLWHIGIALSIPLLLPSVRKSKLTVEYNMIQTLEQNELLLDSHESLLLNQYERRQNDDDDSPDENSLPRLV